MTTPAEKCAERIKAINYMSREFVSAPNKAAYEQLKTDTIAAIIQSEYAETFKVAMEACEKIEAFHKQCFGNSASVTIHGGIQEVSATLLNDAAELARTALELMTPPQQGIKTMGEMK